MILTKELGRLAKWLRILGYDCKFFSEDKLSTLVITALREERVILTRNSRLSRFPGPKMIKINSDFVDKQLKQVLCQLRLRPKARDMFSRCVICNVELQKINRSRVKAKVPAYVYETQEEFMRCPQCKKVYWQGTHWGNVRRYLQKIQNGA
jgi:hypothetical protein